jgi:hypothetical protein
MNFDEMIRIVALGGGVLVAIALLTLRSTTTTTKDKTGSPVIHERHQSRMAQFTGGFGALVLGGVGAFGPAMVGQAIGFLVFLAIMLACAIGFA